MKSIQLAIPILLISFLSCNSTQKENTEVSETYSKIRIIGAMKDVMWKGELGARIQLDTISNTKGLYGLGPESYLRGELLINNGKSYISRTTPGSVMSVSRGFDVSAPFFVYANVTEWYELELSSSVKSSKDVETFIDEKSKEALRPFVFKLIGKASSAKIHIQNLPSGSKVTSPEEAHQGQINFQLSNKDVEIIGFFSTEHKGVFTHHDSFVHMHLITKNEKEMGHLDELEIGKMKLFLPKK
jgi:acetolactate decarboxylase